MHFQKRHLFTAPRTLAALILTSAMLIACGGGSGGGSAGGGTGSGGGATVPVTQSPALALFAGHIGGPGSADGTGATARFHYPSAAATDNAGNLYVTDTFNNIIRKVTPTGVVTTLAGTAGVSGSSDGTGAKASFQSPVGIAVDGSSNVYVADTANNTIRKITPAGVVTTLAGIAGVAGYADGAVATATFDHPSAVAVDGTGNIFVADTYNNLIRRIAPNGEVTTLAGATNPVAVEGQNNFSCTNADGAGAAAAFCLPTGIAIDSIGNLYVNDTLGTIRKVTSAGVVSTLAGSPFAVGSTDGTGSAATFSALMGVATDKTGNVYVADSTTIRRVSPAGVVSTLAGTARVGGDIDGPAQSATFGSIACSPSGGSVNCGTWGLSGIAVDSAGNVYVTDSGNNNIRKLTADGTVSTLAGLGADAGNVDGTGAAAYFSSPRGITTDGTGNIYVADSSNNTVRKVTASGVVTTLAGAFNGGDADGTGSAARFTSPGGLTTDGAGNTYVADTGNGTIRQVSSAGVVTTLAGLAAPGFNFPNGLARDSAGNTYVADSGNNAIRKISPAGVETTLAGGMSGSADGTGQAANFNSPTGMAIDSAGNLYVTDNRNNTIRKVTPAGVVSTIAGTAGVTGSADGTGSAAGFYGPTGIVIDGTGNLYVADTGNNTIRKITPAGKVTTVIGVPGTSADFVPGSLPGRLESPSGVAIFGTSLYITMGNGIAVVTNVP